MSVDSGHSFGQFEMEVTLRIVHVIEYYQPQIGYQEAFLAQEQAALGHEVIVVTSDRYQDFPNYDQTWRRILGDRVVGVGVSSYEGVEIRRLRVAFEFKSRLWLRSAWSELGRLDPDLVIVHNSETVLPIGLALIARWSGHRFTLVFDNHANEGNSLHRLRELYYFVYRLMVTPSLLRTADAIVAIDSESRSFLENDCGVPAHRIQQIPLGADHERFRLDLKARARLRLDHHIAEQELVFIHCGRLTPSKGLDLCISALGIVVRAGHDASLLLVGGIEPADMDVLSRLAASNGVLDRVRFVDNIPNRLLPEYYSAADVAVWAGVVSIGTLEAQSCGLPLIVADSPLLAERVADENGLLFTPGNIDDLAEKMIELAGNEARRQTMGANGRKAIEQKLSWSIIAQQFVDLARPESIKGEPISPK